jgi:hypothetical protein
VIRGTAVGFCVGLALCLPTQAALAQSWRNVSTSRQLRGEERLAVEVEFASGTFRLGPGTASSLYRIQATYDEDGFESETDYDQRSSHILVRVTPHDGHGDLDMDADSPQLLDIALSPAVPVTLDLKIGAARSSIELGGLAVRRASIKTGASESRITFGSPNRVACEEFEIAMGAAELTVVGLGSARCERLKVAGGAGDLTLDFTGSWEPGTELDSDVTMGFGSLTLRVPEDIAVELTMSRLFASVEREGFVKRGDRWLSPNADRAIATLRLHVRAILGDVSFDWVPVR